MALKIITISDGFESAAVPTIGLPAAQSISTIFVTLTAPQVSAGFITLPTPPTKPTETFMEWRGIGQTYGLDYSVSGSTLTFLFRLLPLMLNGDEIIIIYS